MIHSALMDTLINRQEKRGEQKKPLPSSQFAQMLNGKSRGSDNRRVETGKMAEGPIKGDGRREWAHQRARIEMRNRNLENKNQKEVKDTAQEQFEWTEQQVNAWLAELKTKRDHQYELMGEMTPEVPWKTLEELMLLSQSAGSCQVSMDQSKHVTEKLEQAIRALEELSASIFQDQPDADMTMTIGALKRFVDERTNAHQREQTETAPETKEITWETVVQTVKAVPDLGTKAISSDKSQLETQVPAAVDVSETDLNNNPGSSDDQPDLKEFTATKNTLVGTAEKHEADAVIPFIFHQIENVLPQNPLIQALDQQKEQLQQQVLQQVVDKIQVIHGNGQSFVTMHLVPEHLGKLTIQLITDLQQGMTARIYAQTAHAKEMIELNLSQLKDALSGKGVNLTTMEVFVGQDPESSTKQRAFHYQQAQSQRHKAGRQTGVPGVGSQTIGEPIVAAVNPYMRSEGFDKLG